MSPPQVRPDKPLDLNSPTSLAGWDIGLAALALACMTSGFWHLWPGALLLNEAPIGAMILKAGLAALGFVGIATRWEDTCRALARNPLILVLLALACCSAFWAVVPADALRNAIMLVVIWAFGVALSLRFKPRALAEICAFAGVFGLMAQFAAHQGMPRPLAFDGDIAFAIMGSAWAAWRVAGRRPLWLMVLGACCALAFAAGDKVSIGAGAGLILGFGVAWLSALRGRSGAVSIIVTAWFLVVLIIGVTLFALFGADPVSIAISGFFEGLGPNMVIGQGFGIAGQSVAQSLGAGLGIVGVLLGLLIAFATLFQALLGERQIGDGGEGNVAVWFAALGAILVNPADISMFGPVVILLAASSFSISLSCVQVPRRRQSLLQSQSKVPTFPSASAPHVQRRLPIGPTPVVRAAPTLTTMGLRPKV